MNEAQALRERVPQQLSEYAANTSRAKRIVAIRTDAE
jgi:hypothetical protein